MYLGEMITKDTTHRKDEINMEKQRRVMLKLSEKHLVRAGLDYWDKLDVTVYCDYQDFLERNPGAKIYMATTKG